MPLEAIVILVNFVILAVGQVGQTRRLFMGYPSWLGTAWLLVPTAVAALSAVAHIDWYPLTLVIHPLPWLTVVVILAVLPVVAGLLEARWRKNGKAIYPTNPAHWLKGVSI